MAAVNSKPQKACGWTGTGRHRRQRDERVLIRQRTSWDLVWSPPGAQLLPAPAPTLGEQDPGFSLLHADG